jgi:hypothetical protein
MPPLEEEETADTAAAPGVRDASSLGRDREERQTKSNLSTVAVLLRHSTPYAKISIERIR